MLYFPQLKLPPWFQSQMGVPGSDTPEGLRFGPDALVFYVDPGNSDASDNNDGTDPRYPLETIQQGIDNATDGRGDLVLVSPGTYNPANPVVVDKADIRVIGMPIGGNPLQPENGVVVYPAATYTTGPMFILEVPCTIANMDIITRNTTHHYDVDTSSCSVAIDGEGGAYNGGFIHIHHCRFVDWWGADYGVWFYAGSYVLIEDCSFEGFDAGVALGPSPSNNPTDIVIRRNYFAENTTGIESLVTGTPHNVIIQENVFIDYTDAIDFNQAGGGTGDGLVCGNYYETATDAATYDCTVAQAQVLGWNFSGNNYSE